MNAIFSHKIITKEALIEKSAKFKDSLSSLDKNSWYPKLRTNSFDNKLPGTICQNKVWIQYLSVMLYQELKKNTEFLRTKYWKLFVLLKTLSEYFLSPKLSEYQIDCQTKILHQYMSIRLALIDEDDLAPISPKHTFAFHYSDIEKRVGLLSHLHTNGQEG